MSIPRNTGRFFRAFLVFLPLPYLLGGSAEWNLTGGGNWNTNGNWNPATGFPNGSGDTATLGNAISGNSAITLSSDISLDEIDITNTTNSYTVSGQTISFSNGGGTAQNIVVSGGTHTISSTINFTGGTGENGFTSTGQLTLGNITGTPIGGLFVLAPSGTVIYNLNGVNTATITAFESNWQELNNAITVNYQVDGAIPSGATCSIRTGGATSVFNIDANISSANAFILIVSGTCIANQLDGRTVRLKRLSISSSGGAGIFNFATTTPAPCEIGEGAPANFSSAGILAGGAASASMDPTSGGTLHKKGTTMYTLSGTNTYSNRTFIEGNIIRATASAALGASGSGSGVFVMSGAALEVNGTGLSMNKYIFLNGTGVSSAGALRNMTGSNAIPSTGQVQVGWSGGSISASDASIGVDASA